MAMKNKYARRSRISEAKIREIVRYVAADLTALQAAALSGLNRNTVNRLYRGLRERMLLACEAQRPLFGVVEVDESFFGGAPGQGPAWARRLRQNRRLRHLRAAGPRLYRDRSGLLEAHAPGHHPRPGRPAHRHQLRRLARATTAWSIWGMATSASIIPATSSPREPSILTASKASGVWPRSGWRSSKGCPDTPSICT